jgi:transcriptional regulator with GAF, ATPase, and Fis domain
VDELPPAVRGERSPRTVSSDFPASGLDFREAVAEYQSALLREALKRAGGVQRQAAKLLRLSPTTLNEMVHRFGLNED